MSEGYPLRDLTGLQRDLLYITYTHKKITVEKLHSEILDVYDEEIHVEEVLEALNGLNGLANRYDDEVVLQEEGAEAVETSIPFNLGAGNHIGHDG